MAPEMLMETDGHQLAVNMLLELRDVGVDECVLSNEYREGRPQTAILARYLAATRGNDRVEAGFIAVLTDFVGSAFEASPDPEAYEREIERRRDQGK